MHHLILACFLLFTFQGWTQSNLSFVGFNYQHQVMRSDYNTFYWGNYSNRNQFERFPVAWEDAERINIAAAYQPFRYDGPRMAFLFEWTKPESQWRRFLDVGLSVGYRNRPTAERYVSVPNGSLQAITPAGALEIDSFLYYSQSINHESMLAGIDGQLRWSRQKGEKYRLYGGLKWMLAYAIRSRSFVHETAGEYTRLRLGRRTYVEDQNFRIPYNAFTTALFSAEDPNYFLTRLTLPVGITRIAWQADDSGQAIELFLEGEVGYEYATAVYREMRFVGGGSLGFRYIR